MKYQWEAVGSLSSSSAKPLLVKLLGDTVKGSSGTLTNGPAGYTCKYSQVHKHHPSGGVCYKGSLAFPKAGFTWMGG